MSDPGTPDRHAAHRPPRDCPVCGERLAVLRLGCQQCGTELAGMFEGCEFCALESSDRTLLRVFLATKGNVREVGRHLGVSYPTARSRIDDLLGRLGFDERPRSRIEVLHALSRGDLDIEQARELLDHLDAT